MRRPLLETLAGFFILCAGTAIASAAEQRPFSCGDVPNPRDVPKVAPIFHGHAGLNDMNFNCMVWQDFIYLNWPAMRNQRGVPDGEAKFGAERPTVWETYKTVGDVFLPNAANPGPWDHLLLASTLPGSQAAGVSSGAVRRLSAKSKISREVLASMLLGASSIPQDVLKDIEQASGGILYDLNGLPVYYEVAMNRVQYDYIVQNGLYNATTQNAFAQSHVIDLPAAPPLTENIESAIEVKAAWKVLSAEERSSGRFHTTQALLDGGKTPVTVGLVGFHIFIPDGSQGAWGTIAQVDNAPTGQPAPPGTYNFFNPNCTDPGGTKPCAINLANANPGQVVQITPDTRAADLLNSYVQSLIRDYDPASPWQYYKLINVQWALTPIALTNLPVPVSTPLPPDNKTHKPNTDTMVNPVLETFVQEAGKGCFFCHIHAQTAPVAGAPAYAASYSFSFKHATTPK